jgi:hypothetical protein
VIATVAQRRDAGASTARCDHAATPWRRVCFPLMGGVSPRDGSEREAYDVPDTRGWCGTRGYWSSACSGIGTVWIRETFQSPSFRTNTIDVGAEMLCCCPSIV